MVLSIYLFIRKISPTIKGFLFKLLFNGRRIKVGRNFQCEKFPSLQIDNNCFLKIGNDVLFRKDIEIRSHGKSKIDIGNNVRIDRGVRILAANQSEIVLKDGARIGLYTVFNGGDSIYIGEKVLVSGFVYLQTSMHNHKKNKDVQSQGYSHKPVTLKEDSWLGTHVVVLPGCVIGKGAVVGSNAVVTKSIEDYTISAGVPAKSIKERE